ncbi:MAG: GtrA family protein [Bacteroidales bacterium]|nr:GtrA family protein [Bacteroidales bacterium]
MIRKLFRENTGSIWVQLMRYGITGLGATLVDFTVLTVLTECLGEKYLLVWTAIAFISGLAVTYLLSTNWVFNARRFKNRAAEISIFVLIGAVGLGLTELLMWFFATKVDLHYLISKIIAGTTVFIWNFTAKKLILFRR